MEVIYACHDEDLRVEGSSWKEAGNGHTSLHDTRLEGEDNFWKEAGNVHAFLHDTL